jgi:predicted ester cyclase
MNLMAHPDESETNRDVVVLFYQELCNRWRLDLIDDILSEKIHFRASLGSIVSGRDEFKHYLERVRAAFPDWYHRIDEVLAVGDRVVARLTYSGTHSGSFGDLEATGAHVEYVGAGFFRLAGGLIEDAWIVGDTQEFWRALGRL